MPLDGFKWVENTTLFNKDFIENYNEDSVERSFLVVTVQFPEKLHNLHNDLPFSPERMNIGNVEKLGVNLHVKKNTSET